MAQAKEHVTLRLARSVRQALRKQALREGVSQTGLAERYLEEAIKLVDHPGIFFRDGPAGRRAGLVGGPDVWEVIETFLAEDRDAAAAADYLSLPVGLVKAAIDYYADNRDEIEGWIGRNRILAEELEAQDLRRREATGG